MDCRLKLFRIQYLKDLFETKFQHAQIRNIKKMMKRLFGNRTLSSVAIIEFASRSVRDDVLKALENPSVTLKGTQVENLTVKRAK